jgi:hypothetical protein
VPTISRRSRARLKDAGDKDLQRKLYAGITRAMKPVRAEAEKSLFEVLPKRGGLAAAKRRQVKFRTSPARGSGSPGSGWSRRAGR